ncbi:Uncharacterized protein BP5553_09039 [Venustampulla echinocandica]|uniref:Uncharacterized protein n=1 Tax=Venustampulla echinocandica TaxID=2656787 RepID=A0A370TDN8_9HELO|nr:Uncharacterized protein BP5553_09039 [Venustampulla echinocandica]RDL32583.1 Uncharacterized protein BP5553_09039 [Venustampulla echinocandica]
MPPKGKARAFKSKPSLPSKASASIQVQSKGDPPKPFQPSPKHLEPFLPNLSKSHVYITHIDAKPRDFKRNIFAVPVLMNLVIIGLIVWRITIVGPFYMKICSSLMGKTNETTMRTANLPFNEIKSEILRRSMTFMVDLLIYSFVWPWPKAFFLGQTIANPVMWRLRVGFRDKEIIVRRSRRWYNAAENVLDEGTGQDLFLSNVYQAVDPMWMSEKTGYLMLSKDWDLDWKLMILAHKLVDKHDMNFSDFKTTILVHSEEFGWVVIQSAAAGGSAKEEEGRRKIVAFKDELTAMGKENLFFRWIELVQFESIQPGGFGPERQQETMAKAKRLFEDQGVDFDRFWAKVGGMQGMPGMDDM